jgi:hypothetical protein
MDIRKLSPKQAINKAYLKERITREQIEAFKAHFAQVFDRLNNAEKESEEFYKNIVSDFLKQTFYTPQYEINTKGREDLVIHTGKTTKDSVGVIFETKKPNSSEMFSAAKPNVKALHQLIFYYLQERIEHKNLAVKHLIITDIYNWYIFDENLFDRLFYRNTKFQKGYETFKQSGKDTAFFYNEIAKPILAEAEIDLECTHFNLNQYTHLRETSKISLTSNLEDDTKLIPLYKILSPVHLLKLPFANDSNQLDKNFYAELLHILGLEEVKEGSKKLIQRKAKPDEFSLLENAMTKIENRGFLDILEPSKYGSNRQEQVFNIALELCITWINRILFLKLLEAQLISYHKGNKAYRFLNSTVIYDNDRLNKLFFEVLAEKVENRKGKVKTEFARIPYLNSSLFERTELERKTIEINYLDDGEVMPILSQTVLKDDKGKRKTGAMPTLEYLFAFLDAYDFASEGNEGIQDNQRTLINASVLGLIFEKINGYKDGSFFTPAFITMYMCRETLRRAVVQKFQENGYKAADFEALKAEISDRKQANDLINSLKICDPAVGSGHFLVSALNEIIAIKSELGVLSYRDGSRVKHYQIEVQQDELIVTDEETGDIFQYTINDKGFAPKEAQMLQEMLFHEKQTLIENCLFGVDINPNSVKICRLRLWIELLKNAYYTEGGGLETLPNIDINIKQGNSLISRFKRHDDLSEVFKKQNFSYNAYRKAVESYKNATSKEDKKGFEDFLKAIKAEFQTVFTTRIKEYKELSKFKGQLYNLQNQGDLFGGNVDKIEQDRLEKLIAQTEQKVNNIKDNALYRDAFEWRFEFPEVLDTEGGYLGFDVVIGNPPYFSLTKIKDATQGFTDYKTFSKGGDIYCLFYEKGLEILKKDAFLTFITSNSWMRVQYGEALRQLFVEKSNPILLLNIEDTQVFEEATVESNILTTQKSEWANNLLAASLGNDFAVNDDIFTYFNQKKTLITALNTEGWSVGNDAENQLKIKIETGSKLLKDFKNEFYRGITTGLNEAFVIDEKTKDDLIKADAKNAEIIKPILRGRDVQKYAYEFAKNWIIFSRRGLEIKKYPSIEAHLLRYYEELKPRNDGEKIGRKAGRYKWFEIQDDTVYFPEFEKEKIVWGRISDKPKFTLDSEGHFLLDTNFFMVCKNPKYLLTILNSKLGEWYFRQISTSTGMGTNQWLKYKVEQLPIKNLPEAEQAPLIALVEEVLRIKQSTPSVSTAALEAEIDKWVYGLYGLSAEEIALIEGAIK